MTISIDLPATGPIPPGLDRPQIPPGLRPDGPETRAQAAEAGNTGSFGTRTGLAAESSSGDSSGFNSGRTGGTEEAETAPIASTGPILSPETAGNLINFSQLSRSRPTNAGPRGPNDLSDEERARVQQLQQIDREVRAHEQAHARVGGELAGPPQYEFVTGPDGRQYAVAGSVEIRTSAGANASAEERVETLEQVIRAALAPAEPSSQDRAIAAQAEAELAQARADLRAEQTAEREAELAEAAPPTSEQAPTQAPADNQPAPDNPDQNSPEIFNPLANDSADQTGETPLERLNRPSLAEQLAEQFDGENGQNPFASPLLAAQEDRSQPFGNTGSDTGGDTGSDTGQGANARGLSGAIQSFTGGSSNSNSSAGLLDLFA